MLLALSAATNLVAAPFFPSLPPLFCSLLLFILTRGSILWPFDFSYTSYSVPAYPQLVSPCPAVRAVCLAAPCVSVPSAMAPSPPSSIPPQAALFQVVINTRALSSAYAGSSLESSHSAADCQRQKNLHWVSIYVIFLYISYTEIKDHFVKAHPVPGALSTSSAKHFKRVAKCELALKSVAVQ